MSLPTPGDVHVNAPLTNMSVLYAQAQTRFAADRLFPVVTSDKESNSYFKFDKSEWARLAMKPRAVGTPAAEGGYGITTDSFHCITEAVKKLIPDRLRRNSDNPLNQDRAAMRFVTQQALLAREKRFAAAALVASVWSTDITGVASDTPSAGEWEQWDRAGSTPIANIHAATTAIDKLTLGAARPNVFACGQEVWDVLKIHPDILDLLKYGGQLQGTLSKVTTQMVAQLFELDEIIVMSALEETEDENVAGTSTPAYIAGKSGILLFRQATPMIEEVSAGYTMCWQDVGGTAGGWRIKKYRDENVASDVVENESSWVPKVVAPDAGAFIATLIG
ncbi:MAG: hypothetical protein EHM89_00160 [Acidobacteria bacterium]|nr:MAG: hypothetical protein EHM89_00160 [Acidobacteriota bacterium]